MYAEIQSSIGARAATFALAGLLLIGSAAQAQTPYTTTRTSSFTYYQPADGAVNGLLKTETIEPGNAQQCVTTSYSYDPTGNKNGATTANCAGASGQAVFTTRTSGSTFGAVATQPITVNGTTVNVTVVAGIFPSSNTNALNQSESRTTDPRFGAPLTLTGPNALTTSWVVDDFGRTVREQRADGTSSVSAYCVSVPRTHLSSRR